MILTDRLKDNEKETTSLTFFGGLCTESCLNTMVVFLATGHSWLRFPLSVVSPHFCKHTDSCQVIALFLLHIFKLVHHSYLTLNKHSCRALLFFSTFLNSSSAYKYLAFHFWFLHIFANTQTAVEGLLLFHSVVSKKMKMSLQH